MFVMTHTFVVTKHVFCHNKSMLVMTKLCRDKTMFVATKLLECCPVQSNVSFTKFMVNIWNIS